MTFRLEGDLVRAGVDNLLRAWQVLASDSMAGRTVRIDLHGVSSVDSRGLSLLTALHRRGCGFIRSGPYIDTAIQAFAQAQNF